MNNIIIFIASIAVVLILYKISKLLDKDSLKSNQAKNTSTTNEQNPNACALVLYEASDETTGTSLDTNEISSNNLNQSIPENWNARLFTGSMIEDDSDFSELACIDHGDDGYEFKRISNKVLPLHKTKLPHISKDINTIPFYINGAA